MTPQILNCFTQTLKLHQKSSTVNDRVTRRDFLVCISPFDNQGNLFENMKIKNEKLYTCTIEGNDTVSCAVMEVLSAV